MRLPRIQAIVALIGSVAIAITAAAAIAPGGRSASAPLPFGSPQSTWVDASGAVVVELVPARAGVVAYDGAVLKDAQGKPVTVPLGDQMRGEITEAAATAQLAAIEKLQLADACRRGIEVALSVATTGASAAESIANGKAALAKAIAQNGGRTTKSACAAG
jgi:hypothetical protein